MPLNQPPNMDNNHEDTCQLHDLHDAMKSYFESGEFYDQIIMTRGKTFAVHKVVICSQSMHFRRYSQDDWKEPRYEWVNIKGSTCATRNITRLHGEDDHPEAIEAMLRFMYGLEYDSNPDHPPTMLFHSKVYLVAKNYKIRRLEKKVVEKLEASIWPIDDIVSTLYNFFGPIDNMDDEDLWNYLVTLCYERIGELEDSDPFAEFLLAAPIFARSLLWEFADHKED